MKINLSHFEAAVVFALFASIVLGVVTRKTDRERLLYGAKCFGYFMLALFAIGWAMKLGHG
jgi:putative Mn2+ efflux pump MntP